MSTETRSGPRREPAGASRSIVRDDDRGNVTADTLARLDAVGRIVVDGGPVDRAERDAIVRTLDRVADDVARLLS